MGFSLLISVKVKVILIFIRWVMKIADGRILRSEEIKMINRRAVSDWFKNNPNTTITECCKGTGLSYPTVKRHIVAISIGKK